MNKEDFKKFKKEDKEEFKKLKELKKIDNKIGKYYDIIDKYNRKIWILHEKREKIIKS